MTSEVAPPKGNTINRLEPISGDLVAPVKQMPLDIGIAVEKTVGGIEMGILENGIPYLTQAGLARMTGLSRAAIYAVTKEWEKEIKYPLIRKGRSGFIKDCLLDQGYREEFLYIPILEKGVVHLAYPDVVCMAILEYYAFESKKPNQTAARNYRRLARYGLRRFIYDALRYAPSDKWRYFHDRVSLLGDSVPPGYFILFKETTGLAVDLINAGLTVNHKTLPDVSVGVAWAKYWTSKKLSEKYGDRIQFEHNYPSYYPQADSNPQLAWAYPDSALALFRTWFRHEYLTTKFPAYILKKAKMLPGGTMEAEQIADLYISKALGA